MLVLKLVELVLQSHNKEQNRLDRVHAVVSLLFDERTRTVNDGLVDFNAAIGRLKGARKAKRKQTVSLIRFAKKKHGYY